MIRFFLRASIFALAGLFLWTCNVADSRKPDTLTFRVNDSLKTSSGKYDSIELDLYTIQGKDTVFRKILFRGKYTDASQLVNLPLGEGVSSEFEIRVIGFRDNKKAMEIGVPFSGGTQDKKAIVYLAPDSIPQKVNHAPTFLSGLQNASMLKGETKRILIKGKDEDGDPIHFQIQNLDSLRGLFSDGFEAIGVAAEGDSLVIQFTPGMAEGNYRFRIAILDATTGIDVQILTVSVGKVNRPPTLTFDSLNPGPTFRLKEGRTLIFRLLAEDPDTGNIVTFLSPDNTPWSQCGKGSFDSATGSLSFTPSFQCVASGETTFADLIFKVKDNGTPPETGQIAARITVEDSNSSPKWKQAALDLPGKEGREMNLDFSALYLGDDEKDSVLLTSSCGSIDKVALKWTFIPGFRDAGAKACELTATDSHVPAGASKLTLNLSIADSIRAIDVAITSPAKGFASKDSLVIVKWMVGSQAQSRDTTEKLKSEGANTIKRAFTDSLGNTGSDSITVVLDTKPPLPPKVQVVALTNNLKPKWTWKPGGGGNGQYRVKVDSADMSKGATAVIDTTYIPLNNLSHGRHMLFVQERDEAGNWSAVDSGVVIVDLVAPVVKITSPLDGYVTNQSSVSIQWTADGKMQSSVSKTLIEGENVITQSTPDSAGNQGSTSISVTRRGNAIFVNAAKPGPGDGNSWPSALPSLQAALAKAQSGNEIWVAKGTYKPEDGAGPDTNFALKAGVDLYGGFAGMETAREKRNWKLNESILSGERGDPTQINDNLSLVVSGKVGGTFDGFVVEKSLGQQSALSIVGVSMAVRNCTFRSNGRYGYNGGGLGVFQATSKIEDCIFIGNQGMDGASIISSNASPVIRNCIFRGNTAEKGPAIHIAAGTNNAVITNCLFDSNIVTSGNGVIWDAGNSVVDGCVFTRNVGGAIIAYNSSIYRNSIFCANSISNLNNIGAAGIIINSGDPIKIVNCVFSGNYVDSYAGAVSIQQTPANVQIKNSIFAGNSSVVAGSEIKILDPSAKVLSIEYSSIPTDSNSISGIGGVNLGAGIINVNPLFKSTSDLDGPDNQYFTSDDGLILEKGSQCINSGDPSGTGTTDILGAPRVQGSNVDMGAYEQ